MICDVQSRGNFKQFSNHGLRQNHRTHRGNEQMELDQPGTVMASSNDGGAARLAKLILRFHRKSINGKDVQLSLVHVISNVVASETAC